MIFKNQPRRPSDEAGGSSHGAPGGQQVVNDEHPRPCADRPLLHLDDDKEDNDEDDGALLHLRAVTSMHCNLE